MSRSIEKILEIFDFLKFSTLNSSYDSSKLLTKNEGELVSQLRYSHLIGSFLYVSYQTRSDIAYVVSRHSKFTHNPSRMHWIALDGVFRYLKGALDYKLTFSTYPDVIEAYTGLQT